MELVIRRALMEDIPAICAITKEAFQKYASDLGLPHTVSALKETEESTVKDLTEKHIFVALLDNTPVGSIRFEILDNNIAYISRFGVKLNVQNCGVGKALVQAVIDEVTKMALPVVTLHTAAKMTSLVRFYYGMGFYIYSTTKDRGYIRGLFCREIFPEQMSTINLDNIK